ncbi:MAG: DEAD/DEAH box helicase [Lentisphaeria bacterium]|nr:DEAD/DEAH box helicase [Lentisphaeria bacterium]
MSKYILHANWLADCAVVAFWLEDVGAMKQGVPKKVSISEGSSPVHPYVEDPDSIVDFLPEELDMFDDEHVLMLPSSNSVPYASDTLLSVDTEIVPWTVPTAETLAECFMECIYYQDIDQWKNDEIQWGSSLIYWYNLARFARNLYEQRFYVPATVDLEGKSYPSWRAVFTEEVEEDWERVVSVMPPICRSLMNQEGDIRQQSPNDLALSFVDQCLDYLVRRRLKRQAAKQPPLKKTNAPLHRQWINALKVGGLQQLTSNKSSITQFCADVLAWSNYMRPKSYDIPWRLSFELIPPEVEIGPWNLRFVLCSIKNSTQKVLVEQLWLENAVKNYIPAAREIVLSGLGKAVEAFPKLKDAMSTPEPYNCHLSREEAAEFMVEASPVLRRMGFFVYLPDWWEDNTSSLGIKLTVSPGTNSGQDRESFLGVNHLVDYSWSIAIGDEVLGEDEFKDLSEMKQRLIFRQGKWIRMDVEALNNTLNKLSKQGVKGNGKLSQVLKLGTDLEQDGGLPILDFEIDHGFHFFDHQFEEGKTFKILTPPDIFNGTLPPYQQHGFSWMLFIKNLGLGACLADDMGLGKTVQMIATLAYEKTHIEDYGQTLIICPMSVVGNWVKEIERFCPAMRVLVHHGSDRRNKDEFISTVKDYDVVLSTYNLIVRDNLIFKGHEWENIILDEAQNIKNAGTKQSTVIRSLKSNSRFCLTGTPIENRLTELWSLMDFLNPGYLGPINTFRTTFSQPIERDQDQSRARTLQKIIRPFILRRLKSDKEIIRDLPEKNEMKVYCNLTTEQASLYQAVVDEMLSKIRNSTGIERKGLVLSTLTKLKQITNHPVHFLRDGSPFTSVRSGKLQRLEEMLDVVIDSGERALIFSQFTETGVQMRSKLQEAFDIEVLYMHGGTSKLQRDEMIHRFQHPQGPPVFLLSLKAGGVGLNLTEANHVFHFDRWWNPAIEDQATDRTYRIGQKRNVQVHKFICVGTVEEKIDQMIEEKKRLADNIVTAGENMLTELSTDELQEVFALTRDAVIE